MTIQEIISEFDVEGKHFDLLTYSSNYRSCDDTEKDTRQPFEFLGCLA